MTLAATASSLTRTRSRPESHPFSTRVSYLRSLSDWYVNGLQADPDGFWRDVIFASSTSLYKFLDYCLNLCELENGLGSTVFGNVKFVSVSRTSTSASSSSESKQDDANDVSVFDFVHQLRKSDPNTFIVSNVFFHFTVGTISRSSFALAAAQQGSQQMYSDDETFSMVLDVHMAKCQPKWFRRVGKADGNDGSVVCRILQYLLVKTFPLTPNASISSSMSKSEPNNGKQSTRVVLRALLHSSGIDNYLHEHQVEDATVMSCLRLTDKQIAWMITSVERFSKVDNIPFQPNEVVRQVGRWLSSSKQSRRYIHVQNEKEGGVSSNGSIGQFRTNATNGVTKNQYDFDFLWDRYVKECRARGEIVVSFERPASNVMEIRKISRPFSKDNSPPRLTTTTELEKEELLAVDDLANFAVAAAHQNRGEETKREKVNVVVSAAATNTSTSNTDALSRSTVLVATDTGPSWHVKIGEKVRILTPCSNRAAIDSGKAEPLSVHQEQLWTYLNLLHMNELKAVCNNFGIAGDGTKYLIAMKIFQHELDTGQRTVAVSQFYNTGQVPTAGEQEKCSTQENTKDVSTSVSIPSPVLLRQHNSNIKGSINDNLASEPMTHEQHVRSGGGNGSIEIASETDNVNSQPVPSIQLPRRLAQATQPRVSTHLHTPPPYQYQPQLVVPGQPVVCKFQPVLPPIKYSQSHYVLHTPTQLPTQSQLPSQSHTQSETHAQSKAHAQSETHTLSGSHTKAHTHSEARTQSEIRRGTHIQSETRAETQTEAHAQSSIQRDIQPNSEVGDDDNGSIDKAKIFQGQNFVIVNESMDASTEIKMQDLITSNGGIVAMECNNATNHVISTWEVERLSTWLQTATERFARAQNISVEVAMDQVFPEFCNPEWVEQCVKQGHIGHTGASHEADELLLDQVESDEEDSGSPAVADSIGHISHSDDEGAASDDVREDAVDIITDESVAAASEERGKAGQRNITDSSHKSGVVAVASHNLVCGAAGGSNSFGEVGVNHRSVDGVPSAVGVANTTARLVRCTDDVGITNAKRVAVADDKQVSSIGDVIPVGASIHCKYDAMFQLECLKHSLGGREATFAEKREWLRRCIVSNRLQLESTTTENQHNNRMNSYRMQEVRQEKLHNVSQHARGHVFEYMRMLVLRDGMDEHTFIKATNLICARDSCGSVTMHCDMATTHVVSALPRERLEHWLRTAREKIATDMHVTAQVAASILKPEFVNPDWIEQCLIKGRVLPVRANGVEDGVAAHTGNRTTVDDVDGNRATDGVDVAADKQAMRTNTEGAANVQTVATEMKRPAKKRTGDYETNRVATGGSHTADIHANIVTDVDANLTTDADPKRVADAGAKPAGDDVEATTIADAKRDTLAKPIAGTGPKRAGDIDANVAIVAHAKHVTTDVDAKCVNIVAGTKRITTDVDAKRASTVANANRVDTVAHANRIVDTNAKRAADADAKHIAALTETKRTASTTSAGQRVGVERRVAGAATKRDAVSVDATGATDAKIIAGLGGALSAKRTAPVVVDSKRIDPKRIGAPVDTKRVATTTAPYRTVNRVDVKRAGEAKPVAVRIRTNNHIRTYNGVTSAVAAAEHRARAANKAAALQRDAARVVDSTRTIEHKRTATGLNGALSAKRDATATVDVILAKRVGNGDAKRVSESNAQRVPNRVADAKRAAAAIEAKRVAYRKHFVDRKRIADEKRAAAKCLGDANEKHGAVAATIEAKRASFAKTNRLGDSKDKHVGGALEAKRAGGANPKALGDAKAKHIADRKRVADEKRAAVAAESKRVAAADAKAKRVASAAKAKRIADETRDAIAAGEAKNFADRKRVTGEKRAAAAAAADANPKPVATAAKVKPKAIGDAKAKYIADRKRVADEKCAAAVVKSKRVGDSKAKRVAPGKAKHIANRKRDVVAAVESKRAGDPIEAKRSSDAKWASDVVAKRVAADIEAKRVTVATAAVVVEAKRVADAVEAKHCIDADEAKNATASAAAIKTKCPSESNGVASRAVSAKHVTKNGTSCSGAKGGMSSGRGIFFNSTKSRTTINSTPNIPAKSTIDTVNRVEVTTERVAHGLTATSNSTLSLNQVAAAVASSGVSPGPSTVVAEAAIARLERLRKLTAMQAMLQEIEGQGQEKSIKKRPRSRPTSARSVSDSTGSVAKRPAIANVGTCSDHERPRKVQKRIDNASDRERNEKKRKRSNDKNKSKPTNQVPTKNMTSKKSRVDYVSASVADVGTGVKTKKTESSNSAAASSPSQTNKKQQQDVDVCAETMANESFQIGIFRKYIHLYKLSKEYVQAEWKELIPAVKKFAEEKFKHPLKGDSYECLQAVLRMWNDAELGAGRGRRVRNSVPGNMSELSKRVKVPVLSHEARAKARNLPVDVFVWHRLIESRTYFKLSDINNDIEDAVSSQAYKDVEKLAVRIAKEAKQLGLSLQKKNEKRDVLNWILKFSAESEHLAQGFAMLTSPSLRPAEEYARVKGYKPSDGRKYDKSVQKHIFKIDKCAENVVSDLVVAYEALRSSRF